MARTAALAAPLFAILTATAAHATDDAGNRARVEIQSEVTDRFYRVDGTTAAEVFASIERNGPGDAAGLVASGLTRSEISFSLSSTATSGGCRLDDVTLRIDIEVHLPLHGAVDSLDDLTRRRWEAFAAAVEFHEYRHVEIELRGVEELADRFESAPVLGRSGTGPADCNALAQTVIDAKRTQTRSRHDAFHSDERRSVAASRAHIEAAIDALDGKLNETRTSLDDVRRRLNPLTDRVESLQREVQATIDAYGHALPPDLYAEVRARQDEQRRIEETRRDLIRIEGGLVRTWNEHVATRAARIEELSWTR